MGKERKNQNNSAYRYLCSIMYGDVDGIQVQFGGTGEEVSNTYVVNTAKVALSLRTTSFRLIRGLEYLHQQGLISELKVSHGSLSFEF